MTGTSVGCPQTLEAGKTYTQQLTLSYPGNISEMQNGKICLMFMEGNAGIFLNAITVPFTQMTPVEDIVAEDVEAQASKSIYNLQGQRLQRPQHGINIINGKKIIK